MASRNPLGAIDADARRARRRLDLAPNGGVPACLYCGTTDVDVLRRAEGHHLAGRHHDRDLIAVVCLSCHVKATALLRDAGVDMRPASTPELEDAAWHQALAVHHDQLAAAHRRQAQRIEERQRSEGRS